jgi:ATP-dependent Clp protease ATP-binding subunit ClpA
MSRILDSTKHSLEAQALLATFKRKIVGQEDATHALLNIVESFQAGFADPNRPAGNALFLGPTGTGKTATVLAMCAGLFGDEKSCLKVDCAEFQHGHELAKLTGSPPGYLGHRETHPMITQERLSLYHTDKVKLSVILFDEIEKASDTLWNLLLGILDKGVLSLGDNRTVNFNQTIVIMTSNLGSAQMSALADGGIGFQSFEPKAHITDAKIDDIATQAAKKKFTPEFFNRIEHVSVFHTLTREQIEHILDIETGNLHTRLLFNSRTKFFFHLLESAKKRILKEGYDRVYGARHLKRTLERLVQTPLARIVASGQIIDRDVIIIEDTGGKELEFSIEEQRWQK